MTTRRPIGLLILIAAGQAINSLQGVIALPLMIRWAGDAVYGANVLLISLINLLFAFLSYGIPYRYQRNLASAASWDIRRQLFEPQFTFQVAVVAVVSVITLIWVGRFERLLFGDSVHFAPWLLVGVVVSGLVLRQSSDYFQYSGQVLTYTVAWAGTPCISILTLVAVALVNRRLSLNDLLAVQILANLAVATPLLVRLSRQLGIPRLRLPLRVLLADARIGWLLIVELVADNALRISDRYLITLFLTVAAVGTYQPAYTLASLVLFLPNLATTYLTPILSRMTDARDTRSAEKTVNTFVQLFLMIAIPFAAGALMLGPTIISAMTTPEIARASRWVPPLVACGGIFYGLASFASMVAFVLGRTRTILMASLIGAALNLSLNLILLPALRDITVAAATTLIGYAASGCYLFGAVGRTWRLEIGWASALRYIAASMTMCGLLWLLGFRPATPVELAPLSLLSLTCAGIAIYFVALGAFGGVRRDEMAELLNFVRQRADASEQIATR